MPSLLAARRIAANPHATFYSVAAVGLAAVGLAYLGCTVAVGHQPITRSDLAGPGNAVAAPRRGVGHDRRRIQRTVEPLLSRAP